MPDQSHFLATTEWLSENLASPDLCVLECTVFLRPREDGRPGFLVVPGQDEWAAGHIPGAVFADLHHDLSDTSRVVLYDRAGNMWAARIWWMLRAFGFDNARVLDGGWTKWTSEGRPISSEAPAPAPAKFTTSPRPGLIATKEDVFEAMASGQACIVNALNAAQHRGEVAPYGRPGRIARSVNVPAMGSAGIVDPQTQLYHPLEEIRRRFDAAGARPGERLITYCGGGIAASSAAFAAVMAGYTDVAVYDASLSEWAADPSLPMETG